MTKYSWPSITVYLLIVRLLGVILGQHNLSVQCQTTLISEMSRHPCTHQQQEFQSVWNSKWAKHVIDYPSRKFLQVNFHIAVQWKVINCCLARSLKKRAMFLNMVMCAVYTTLVDGVKLLVCFLSKQGQTWHKAARQTCPSTPHKDCSVKKYGHAV